MIKVKGLNETIALISSVSDELVDDISDICTLFMLNLESDVKSDSPVGEKRGGTFRASWDLTTTPKPEGGISSHLVNPMIYAPPLEVGSPSGSRPWPNVGPRTVMEDGRIFSSQAPGGMIRKKLEDGRLTELNTLFMELIREL